jgi:hypothetical protein
VVCIIFFVHGIVDRTDTVGRHLGRCTKLFERAEIETRPFALGLWAKSVGERFRLDNVGSLIVSVLSCK